MKAAKRMKALLLALCMLLTSVALAEGVSTPTDLTPAPTEAVTQAPVEATAEPPAETATDIPTEIPTDVPTDVPTDLPTDVPTEALTEIPTDAPTEAPTETPTELPTEMPTETPTAIPTDAPTEIPTQAPTPAPTAAPTEAPWDEAACDHANVNCAQAPACDLPDCVHVAQDANGLDVPLCAKGRWVLDRQDELARNELGGDAQRMTRSIRVTPIDLNKGDATLYRSGRYIIRGGEARPGAKLTVAENRVVALDMTGATVEIASLNKNVDAALRLVNARVSQLTLAQAREIALDLGEGEGSGSWIGMMQVDRAHVTVKGGEAAIDQVENTGRVTIVSGSVRASLTEDEGRTMTAFPASGATLITVDGGASTQLSGGQETAYLWLPAPREGFHWACEAAEGTQLRVYQQQTLPESGGTAIVLGQTNALAAGQTYSLAGTIPAGTVLTIDEENVSVVLDNAVYAGEGALIRATKRYTLYTRGTCAVKSAAGAALAGPVDVRVEGSLALSGVEGQATFAGDRIAFDTPPAGYTRYAVVGEGAALPDNLTVTLDGAVCPLLTCQGGVLLPTPAGGAEYAMELAGARLAVTTTRPTAQEQTYVLNRIEENPVAVDAQRFTLTSDSGASGVGAAEKDVILRATAGSGTLRGAAVGTLTAEGAQTALTSEGTSVIKTLTVTGGGKLQLSCASGRLTVGEIAGDVTLHGNIQTAAQPGLTITLTRADGQPGEATTLRLGGETYAYTTFPGGVYALHGFPELEGQAVAAYNDAGEVYTGVVRGGQAALTTGLTISDVAGAFQADGTLRVTFTCSGAQSAGVQYVVGPAAQELPDDFVAQAQRVDAANGQAVIGGLQAGDVVTYRVYVNNTAGVALTAASADGFQFSQALTAAARIPFTVEAGAADADYTGKAYKNPLTLPAGATVTYLGSHLNSQGVPVKVGEYVMRVTIPEGDPLYLPGTYDVRFTIRRIELIIIPGPNQEKYEGEEDPVFEYEVKGLLPGDELLGELLREPGEEAGNYRFVVDGFEAPEHYRLRLTHNANTFTILPASFDGGGGYVFSEPLHPVQQKITRADGRVLAVVLNTQESLKITYSVFGSVVLDAETNQPRPFSPSLSWNQETDEVLLRLRATAELNKDGGYVTDANGDPLWGGRTLRISYLGLRHLNDMGVDAVSLQNKDGAVTVRTEDFLSEVMQAVVKEQGGSLKQVRFRVTVIPTEETPDAVAALRPVTSGWKVSAALLLDNQREVDVTGLLPSLTVAVNMEPVASLMADMARYEEETFAEQFVLTLAAEDAPAALDAAFVIPYMPEEAELVEFPCLMYTSRYLLASLSEPGTVYAVNRK